MEECQLSPFPFFFLISPNRIKSNLWKAAMKEGENFHWKIWQESRYFQPSLFTSGVRHPSTAVAGISLCV